ncbi:MAG: polysaccharide export protein [Thermoanaerobaculia bacterium]|nr:polysaccharide export protein [Thermoanaerobaculia bacterium]
MRSSLHGHPEKRWRLLILGYLTGFVAMAWASPLAAQGQVIGPKDQLQIRVEEIPSLPSDYEVGADGTITLGVAGRIDVQGLTEEELANRIQARLLEQGLRRASVDIRVIAYRSRPVTVLGAVERPGNQTIPGRSTLLDVLLAAGGLADSHGMNVRVRRRADNGLTDQVEVAVVALFEQGDQDVNLPIYPGDVIHVPEARTIQVLLMGEVAQVGELTFSGSERATVLTAVAKAGGLTETAADKITIQRLTESGERREIVVDFQRILNGRAPDLPLEDGDLLVVKESFF